MEKSEEQVKNDKLNAINNMEKQVERKMADSFEMAKGEDKNVIERVYRELKQNILETLHKNGYRRDSIDNAEQILDRNKYEIQKAFQVSRETKVNAQMSNRKNTINTNEVKEVSKDEMEEQVKNRKLASYSMEKLTDLTKEIDKDINSKVMYKIDDTIQTVLPAELRRIINLSPDRRLAEHVNDEVSRYLSRNVLERLKEGYKDVTKKQNEMLFNEVDRVLQDYGRESLNEYRRTMEGKEKETGEKQKDDSFEGKLKKHLVSEEDQFKNYIESDSKNKEIDDKSKESDNLMM